MMVGTGSKEQSATARRNNDMWNQDGGGVGGPGIRKGKLLIISKPIGVKQTEP